MPVTETRIQPPPMEISSMFMLSWAQQVLKASLELNLFTPLKSGPKTPKEVAQEIKADEKGVPLLMDALVGMNLLQKSADHYDLTEEARLYLLPDSELYFKDFILRRIQSEAIWEQLAQVVKTGKNQAAINQQASGEAFFPALAAAIFPMSFTTAQAVAQAMKAESLPANAKVLDVAAGSGVWSIPFALNNPKLQVEALDFPATLAVTRQFAQRYHLEDRYTYLEGSWQEVSLEENRYDIVILGHICHSEGWEETRTLLVKTFKALKPGGRIVIAEFYANKEKSGPLPALLFAINMFLLTDQGCVFSDEEMKDLLVETGFSQAERLSLDYYGTASPVMIATKA